MCRGHLRWGQWAYVILNQQVKIFIVIFFVFNGKWKLGSTKTIPRFYEYYILNYFVMNIFFLGYGIILSILNNFIDFTQFLKILLIVISWKLTHLTKLRLNFDVPLLFMKILKSQQLSANRRHYWKNKIRKIQRFRRLFWMFNGLKYYKRFKQF